MRVSRPFLAPSRARSILIDQMLAWIGAILLSLVVLVPDIAHAAGTTVNPLTFDSPLKWLPIGRWSNSIGQVYQRTEPAGNLWGIGSNRNGALGTVGLGGNCTSLVKVDTNVEYASAGRRTSVYVKTDGSLWALGDNRWKKLSATLGETITTPLKLLDSASFVDSGEHQILAVDGSGKLYYAGWRTLQGFGQGNGNDPALAHVMDGVKEADIYFGDMVILTKTGDVYVYGMNTANAIGSTVTSGAPKKLRSGVLHVAAGYGFTAYLLEDGTILIQGDNSFGQAGNGTTGGSVNMSEANY